MKRLLLPLLAALALPISVNAGDLGIADFESSFGPTKRGKLYRQNPSDYEHWNLFNY